MTTQVADLSREDRNALALAELLVGSSVILSVAPGSVLVGTLQMVYIGGEDDRPVANVVADSDNLALGYPLEGMRANLRGLPAGYHATR